MRSSKQRKVILDIINDSDKHNSTQEIYLKARDFIPNISLGTVYRNLNQLVDFGMICRIKTAEGMDRYDNLNRTHHHFVCDCCKQIVDIFQKFDIDTDILSDSNVTHYTIQFHGKCEKCLKKERKI